MNGTGGPESGGSGGPFSSTPTTEPDGTVRWLNAFGKLHRTDGPAARVAGAGDIWYFQGKVHREDGPAVIQDDGTLQWWERGKRKSPEEEAELTAAWNARTPKTA